MPAELYLSRFQARNFRSFGEVTLEIPAEPGVVLLEGPNGLGKTSWMEAVELSLSGEVHRWNQQADDHKSKIASHIHRRGAARNSCQVQLSLGDRQVVWRLNGAPEPATWLCEDPDRWSLNANNLNGFLRGTHLLPQSPSLRLLHLPAKERWNQVLRVVSGYSEIDDLSAALQGAKSPLTKEVSERDEQAKQASALHEAWVGRVRAVLDRRAQAEAAGALVPPSRAVALVHLKDRPVSAPEDRPIAARELVAHINTRLAAVRAEQVELRARQMKLTSLAGVPVRWKAERNAVLELDEQVDSKQAEEGLHREELKVRKEADQAAAERVKQVDDQLAQARERTDGLGRLVGVRTGLSAAQDALATAQEEQSKAGEALEVARGSRDLARSNLNLRQAYEAKDKEHKARVAAHEAAVDAWRTVQQLTAKRVAPAAARASLREAVTEAQDALTRQQELLTSRKAETKRARTHAEQVRQAAGEVQGLLTALARHVSHESPECPLCLQPYGAGELLQQVMKAEKKQGPLVAAAEAALRDTEAREEEAATKIAEAKSAHDAAVSALEANQKTTEELDAQIREQRDLMPDIEAGQELVALARVRVVLAQEGRQSSGMPGTALEPSAVLSVRAEQAEGAFQAAESSHNSAVKTTQEAKSAMAQLEAQSTALQERFGVVEGADLETLLTQARDSRGQAEAAAETANIARGTAKSLLEQAEKSLVEATEQLTSARANREKARARQQDLERSWTAESLVLPPTKDVLERATEQTIAHLATTAERKATLTKASEGLGRWLDLAAVDEDSAALDKEAGGQGPTAWNEHRQRLGQRLAAATEARSRAEQARDRVLAMASAATAKREAMRDELQDRLRPVLSPMLRSLIVEPLIANAVIELAETRRRTGVHAKVGEGGNSADLLALASEGQLSGVNLAIQLSMALAFRWSRWPAVLLDDPSQYSDVVHSTNLVETLRVLARHHGFQVFLATHERDFALYVERKFRNDGLPATRVMFRQPSDRAKGVIPKVAQ